MITPGLDTFLTNVPDDGPEPTDEQYQRAMTWALGQKEVIDLIESRAREIMLEDIEDEY